jgi:hypothetical protein
MISVRGLSRDSSKNDEFKGHDNCFKGRRPEVY